METLELIELCSCGDIACDKCGDAHGQRVGEATPAIACAAAASLGVKMAEGPFVNIAGKFFTEAEAREIDAEIDKLDALMKQRRARVLAAMDAEQCSCSTCREVDGEQRQLISIMHAMIGASAARAQLFPDCTCDGSTVCAACNVMIIAARGAG